MIRRIKSCQSCHKRFTTASGATLCLPCRKDNIATNRNSVASTSTIDCSDRRSLEDTSKSIPAGVSNEYDNTFDGETLKIIPSFCNTAAIVENIKKSNIGATHEVSELDTLSISPSSAIRTANQHETVETLDDIYTTRNVVCLQKKRMGESAVARENCCGRKKVKISSHDHHIDDSNVYDLAQLDHVHYPIKNTEVAPSNIDEEKTQIQSPHRMYSEDSVPLNKSTGDSGGKSGDRPREYSGTIDFSLHEDDGCNVSEGDESEILCWDSSEPEPPSLRAKNFEYDDLECSTPDEREQSSPCLSIHNSIEKNSHDSENGLPSEMQSPHRDMCYICGSDLSKLSTGIRGRVAHMKRCSAKHGIVPSSMDTDFGLDFDSFGEDELVELSRSQPSNENPDKAIFNPYAKAQWNRDASIDLNANKQLEPHEPTTLMKSQPQQTILDRFLKAPVRSLTNVLMAGSRNLAKSKAIEKKKSDAFHESKPRGRWGGGGWAPNQIKGNCPAYKKIPGTDFICDGFLYASHSLSSNYFLTHFHSDHYGGITKQWNVGTIYCSVATANLVHQELGVEKRFLHPLPMNTPTVVASKDKPITVTLLDANHCPGAAMFVFEIGNKKILHVGDFRWNQSFMMAMPQLRAFSNMTPRLDEIFLDTTYCDPKYALPTQDEAIAAAIKVVKDEISTAKMMGTNTLLLFGSYTIGKEKIYLSVAEYLQTKVYVDKRRLRILSALEWPKERMNLFTTKKSESYLWVVPLGHVNFKKLPEYMEDGNKNKAFSKPYGRVVGFRPTGWTYSTPKKSSKPLSSSPTRQKLISSKTSGRYTVHGVPYSEHSSFPELVDCLRCLKPKKIITTVSTSKSEEQCRMLLNAVNSSC